MDSSDTERIRTSAEEFHAILDEEELRDALILVYANKQARSLHLRVTGARTGLALQRSTAQRIAPAKKICQKAHLPEPGGMAGPIAWGLPLWLFVPSAKQDAIVTRPWQAAASSYQKLSSVLPNCQSCSAVMLALPQLREALGALKNAAMTWARMFA